MRAIAVRAFRGSPEEMTLPRPEVGAGEVGVRLEAAGMNPFDAKIVDGILDGRRPHRFPLVLGTDGAGIVDTVGRSVGRFRVGDRVFGQFLHDPVGIGTYAELSTVPESIGVAKVPDALSSAEAAAVPTSGMTALDALERLRLPSGGSVLLLGASGGVGSFATALAAAAGHRVIAAVRPEAFDRARRLGASDVVEAGPNLADEVHRLSPTGVDGLLDVMSPADRFADVSRLVRPGGTAATTVYVARPDLAPPGVTVVNIDLQPTAALLERLVGALSSHRIGVPVERRIPLEAAPAALADLRAGRGRGKTVIEI